MTLNVIVRVRTVVNRNHPRYGEGPQRRRDCWRQGDRIERLRIVPRFQDRRHGGLPVPGSSGGPICDRCQSGRLQEGIGKGCHPGCW